MASIFPIIAQGIAKSPGTIIYNPSVGNEGLVNNIRINNTVNTAYTIALYRYIKTKQVSILLYRVALKAGDWINDDTDYSIKSGDYLFLETDNDTTVYVINGRENLSP